MDNKNPKWLDRKEYPFESRFFKINGQNMHYIDEGVGELLLFVHGTPSWSFDFRNVIKPLMKNYRCIAVDHIGFGLSDKPKHYDYSTQNHSRSLEQFILQQDLHDITLVVHDFGGPIALNFAIQHPERIKNLVILNSWLWSSEDDPDYKKLKRILKSPLLPLLYRYFNFSARYVLPSAFGDKKLSRHLKKHYTAPFSKPRERSGTIAFAHSLLHDQDWFESLWNQKNATCGDKQSFVSIQNKHTLFIWGMKDPVLKPSLLEKFESGFPNSTTLKLPTSGHFPQEEQPNAVAEAIAAFLDSEA